MTPTPHVRCEHEEDDRACDNSDCIAYRRRPTPRYVAPKPVGWHRHPHGYATTPELTPDERNPRNAQP